MKIKNQLLVVALLAAAMILALPTKAQVTIGALAAPDSNAVLDLRSNNKWGLLLPRVELTSTLSPSPLKAHVAGMFVYNTATRLYPGADTLDVAPGIYYNDGKQWLEPDKGYGQPTGPGQVLVSDSTGTRAIWQYPVGTLITGTVPGTVTFNPTTYSTQQSFYSGCYITLPAGSWRVDCAGWLQAVGSALALSSSNNRIFASMLLSTSSTSVIQPPAPAGVNMKSFLIPDLQNSGSIGIEKYGNGAIFVNLTAITTLYLWFDINVAFTSTTTALPNATVFQLIAVNNGPSTFGPYCYLVGTKI